MLRSRVFLALVGSVALLAADPSNTSSPIDQSDTDALALVTATATNYGYQIAGVSTFVATSHVDVHIGPLERTGMSEVAYAELDGSLLRKRVLRLIDRRREADETQRDQHSNEPDAPNPPFGAHLPITPAFIGDYSYSNLHAADGHLVVAFTTHIKDTLHGNGTIDFAPAEQRVTTIHYTPAVLTAGVIDTSLTITFDKITPDRWDIVQTVRDFTGRSGLVVSRGEQTIQYARYQRYGSTPAALDALGSITSTAN
jgi:hypothetical protein